LSILFIFSENQLFVSFISLYGCFFFVSISLISALFLLLVFSSPVIWYFLSSHGFVCFHILCAEFLVQLSVVVARLSYIVLVSVYRGRFLLLCQFWMMVLLGRVS
jgi:hypothetical protein